ncbi:MAG: thioredoxin reductase [Thermoleophilaceae bacterium]|jgi:thioredoxin reductase (NADPH)|nr:thioredoxin reductase [Thermoleophilaceae bacterium]
MEETPDRGGAFPRLNEDQLRALAAIGERRPTHDGEVLFREGDERYDFYVVLEGKVAVVADYGHPDESVIAVHGPRRFLGELSLLTGQTAFFTALVREPGEVLAVPAERLRELVTQDPVLGDLVLRAYLLRRDMLIGIGAGVRIVGSRFSPETRRLRELVARNRLPHRWLDLEKDPEAEALLDQLGVAPGDTPIVIWAGGRVSRNPTPEELARLLGLKAPVAQVDVCDMIVAGAGPAGLAAAVYGASEGLDTIVIDSIAVGGQAGTAVRIENYLGFPAGISGTELAARAAIQAEKFGARISVPADAASLRLEDGHHVVGLSDGTEVTARTVLVATGAHYRRLPVPRLSEFESTSVFYEATPIEAQVCAGDPVVVVGGGNSAGQACLFLTRHATRVSLLLRGGDLRKDMSRYLADRVEAHADIEVFLHTEVRELVGEDGALEAVEAEHDASGERRRIEARALFVFIGAEPCTPWLGSEIALDDRGFVLTGPDVLRAATNGEWRDGRPPLLLETSRPGVLAVGDVRSGSIKRVASAVGEGSMAVRLVHEHLAD